MDINKTIIPDRIKRGRELKIMRINAGLTQVGLYNFSGIGQKTISKIERGLVSWSIDTELIIKFAIDNWNNSGNALPQNQ